MEAISSFTREDVYTRVTNSIVSAIEQGAAGFKMPWHRSGLDVMPTNALTRKQYRGINLLSLWASGIINGYSSSHWATYWQWNSLGAQVRKGEKATSVLFYKPLSTEHKEEEDQPESIHRYVARSAMVFNSDQVDGWHNETLCVKEMPALLVSAEAFVQAIGGTVRYGGDVACYRTATDAIHMPERHRFIGTETISGTEAFYATLLHEHVHWTGHKDRLNRDLSGRFGSSAYAMEELVAELGAAFLCSELGISVEPRIDHAAYVGDWLKVLRSEKKAIFTASSAATVSCTYLHELVKGRS